MVKCHSMAASQRKEIERRGGRGHGTRVLVFSGATSILGVQTFKYATTTHAFPSTFAHRERELIS